jgi:two-component system sensor histidine kinase UhpB
VEDNGKGITERQISSPKSLGFIGMRERVYPWGGEVKIEGKAGKGTTVTVTIPLNRK